MAAGRGFREGAKECWQEKEKAGKKPSVSQQPLKDVFHHFSERKTKLPERNDVP